MVLYKIPFVQSGRSTALILFLLAFALIIYYIRRERLPFIRRPAALDAIEEGIGRATEMGRPAIYTYGLSRGMFSYYTVAALSILRYVARMCAATETKLIVPTGGDEQSYAVRPVALEIIQNACREAGKPELFNADDVPFFSGMQFAYGMSTVGLLLSESPGFFMMSGNYGADIMMMAETGMNVGAMTITTTTSLSYAACMAGVSDYMMLGEETPAAGAYLSKDVGQIASLRNGDIFKIASILVVIVGSIILQFGIKILSDILNA